MLSPFPPWTTTAFHQSPNRPLGQCAQSPKMQCSVYLFGRIGIGNSAPAHCLLLPPPYASPPVSSDSKSSHPIQHSKPHRVPLGGDPDRFVQPHVIGVSAGPYHAAVVTATGDVYAKFHFSALQTVTHFLDTPGEAALLVNWLQVAGTMQFGRRWSKPVCTADRCILYGSTKLRAAALTPS